MFNPSNVRDQHKAFVPRLQGAEPAFMVRRTAGSGSFSAFCPGRVARG
jgi:hypothetical protein